MIHSKIKRVRASRQSLGNLLTRVVVSSLLVGCLLVAPTLAGETSTANDEVNAAVQVSKGSVQVAEPFDVEINLVAPKGTSVTFPEVGMSWGPFDVLEHHDRFAIPASDGSSERTWTRVYTLETIETGDLELPELELQIESSEGDKRWVERTQSQTISVVSVLENKVDPLQFRDIKGPLELAVSEPQDSHSLNGWVVGLGAALVLGFVALALARRRKWASPREWAQSEIQALRDSSEFQKRNANFCVDRLDEILRSFLEWQFSIPAIHMTGTEIYHALHRNWPDSCGDDLQSLLEWLETTEQVKFAGAVGAVGELDLLPGKLEQLLDRLELAFIANALNEVVASESVTSDKGDN